MMWRASKSGSLKGAEEGRASSRLNLQMCANEKRKWKTGVVGGRDGKGRAAFRLGESALLSRQTSREKDCDETSSVRSSERVGSKRSFFLVQQEEKSGGRISPRWTDGRTTDSPSFHQ